MIDELGRELTRVGIRGARRDRILAEFADHLVCDPAAQLGDPRQLAEQFADELATSAARRTAFWTFGALVVTASAIVVAQGSLPTIPDIAAGRSLVLAGFSTLGMVIGSQVAFVAGCLAALRALRFGGVHEVGLVRRRISVALGAGAVTAAGSALYAVNFWEVVPDWWAVLTVACAGAAALPLAGTAFAFARAGRLAVSRADGARGLSADLGPLAQPVLIGAAAVIVMLVATAVLEGSLLQGLIRAGFEAFAFAICFFAFRRPLALTD